MYSDGMSGQNTGQWQDKHDNILNNEYSKHKGPIGTAGKNGGQAHGRTVDEIFPDDG